MKAKPRPYSPELLEHRIAPATFVVTTLADSGAGSLRQAILDANGAAGADTVVFKEGLTGTIDLTGGQMDITDDVAIKGPGAAKLAVNAGGNSRIFNIDDGSIALLKTARISGLNLANGSSGSSGGAIFSGETLILKKCVVSGGNSASNGGGIFVDNAANLETGKFVISGCKIIDNSADGTAGGVYANTKGNVKIVGSIISGNSASNRGGLYANIDASGTGNITIKNSTISGNSSSGSVGGAGLDNDHGGKIRVTGSKVSGNTAQSGGGGLYFDDGIVTVSNTTVSNNHAAITGGAGIWVNSAQSFTLSNSRVVGNSAADNLSMGGGILLKSGNSANIIDSLFKANTAGISGGGIEVNNGTQLTVSGSTFEGNLAIGDIGGGISGHDGATIKVTGSTFLENSSGDDGAGIGTEGFGAGAVTLQVKNSIFRDGHAGNDGGGIRAEGDGSLLVTGSKFINNTAVEGGGGLYAYLTGTTDIVNSLFKGNITSGNNGGGLYLGESGVKTITGSVIKDNISASSGGGVSVSGGELTITSSKITGNIATFKGGGVYNQSASPVQVVASVIAGNIAPVDPDESGLFA